MPLIAWLKSSNIIEGNKRSSFEAAHSIFNHQFFHDLNAALPSDSKVFLWEHSKPECPSSDFLILLVLVYF